MVSSQQKLFLLGLIFFCSLNNQSFAALGFPPFGDDMADDMAIDYQGVTTNEISSVDAEMTPQKPTTQDDDLLSALEQENVLYAQRTLQAGANPNARGVKNFQALCIVIEKNNIALFDLLMQAGANYNAILDDESHISVLYYATRLERLPMVQRLITWLPALDVNARVTFSDDFARPGDSALHAAVRLGRADLVVTLLQHKNILGAYDACPDMQNFEGFSPVDLAIITGRMDMIQLFTLWQSLAGARPINWNLRNGAGWSAQEFFTFIQTPQGGAHDVIQLEQHLQNAAAIGRALAPSPAPVLPAATPLPCIHEPLQELAHEPLHGLSYSAYHPVPYIPLRSRLGELHIHETIQHTPAPRPVGEDHTCSICQEQVSDKDLDVQHTLNIIPTCGHVFHIECLRPWITRLNTSCPNCREETLENFITFINSHQVIPTATAISISCHDPAPEAAPPALPPATAEAQPWWKRIYRGFIGLVHTVGHAIGV